MAVRSKCDEKPGGGAGVAAVEATHLIEISFAMGAILLTNKISGLCCRVSYRKFRKYVRMYQNKYRSLFNRIWIVNSKRWCVSSGFKAQVPKSFAARQTNCRRFKNEMCTFPPELVTFYINIHNVINTSTHHHINTPSINTSTHQHNHQTSTH
jgi:hypothetical protein